ncbi:Enkurin domain-containing protein 1 [Armadillidium vulgare]|nr:Enkurin domain-containing protein 1 [Armadillidium vulgare]
MNEPIMRRGLSPEGCKVREKYQGSLLNDEFGVTSKPIHMKIEKDFLKENVLRLKEIQAKYRSQESKPRSGNQPVKAIRPSNIDLSFGEKVLETDILEKKTNNPRDGSAHSDYFSLPDDTQNVPDCTNSRFSPSQRISKIYDCDKYSAKISSLMPQEKFSDENQKRIDLRSTFVKDKMETPTLKFHISQHPTEEYFSNSPLLKHNKVYKVIEKIKSKQPACEINTEYIWRDIRREHRTLFPKDDCLSVTVPHTLQVPIPKNEILSKNYNFPVKTSSLVRTCSLDRNAINRARLLRSQNCDSPFSLNPLFKSSSTNKLLCIEHCNEKFGSSPEKIRPRRNNGPIIQKNESLLNCTNAESENRVNSTLSSSSVNSLKCAIEECEHLNRNDTKSTNVNCNNNNNNNAQPISFLESSKTDIASNRRSLLAESFDNEGEKNIVNYSPTSISSEMYDSACAIKEKHDLVNGQIQNADLHSLSVTPCLWDSQQERTKDFEDNIPWEKKKGFSIPNLSTVETGEKDNPIIVRRKYHSKQDTEMNLPQRNGSPLLRSKSSNNLHVAGEPPPTYKRGQIPRYLKIRKAEAQKRLEEAAAVDPLCPPGHSPVPDYERRNTLHLLKKAQIDVMSQLSALPLAQDTLRVRKLKQDLEMKLNQIEEGIGIFSQNKVYVLNDE